MAGDLVSECKHAHTRRGKDAPRRWGSYRTFVCLDCGAFQLASHLNERGDRWYPKSEYADATAAMELD